jgi:menaquinol-cytochrome c reductase iron-sulfur subunit
MSDAIAPDSPPGVATPRRSFLKGATGALAALVALALGAPAAKMLLTPARSRKNGWARVGPVDAIPAGAPAEVKFPVRIEDAYHVSDSLRSAWVVRQGAAVTAVFSPVCTHLGCHFLWNPALGEFACPCHASLFSPDGRVLSGPAPRPLDPLEHRVEGGVLYVKWQEFRTGTTERIPV